jgi:glycosyltransferase involved in cell wall biosynthesis
VRELADALRARTDNGHAGANAFARDAGEAAGVLARLDRAAGELVVFVGKLIVSKGVDLLICAWPLVLAHAPRARLLIVGFGAFREPLERLRDALAAGDLQSVSSIAHAGRALESDHDHASSEQPLRHLLAFLGTLRGEARKRYLAAARFMGDRVLFSGRLEHDELAELLPACTAMVVPSTFPESFGMVAAESAACGVLPVTAAHSGLAEVGRVLAAAVPAEVAPLLSFPVGDGAVAAIAERVSGWLATPPAMKDRARAGLVAATRDHWSWERVARGVLAAAGGELEALQRP